MFKAILAAILISTTAYASQEYCGRIYDGKWDCDTDIFGKKIIIRALPPGHGIGRGAIAFINAETNETQLFMQISGYWSSGKDFYQTKGHCTPYDSLEIEFKGREINYRKSSGTIIVKFEEFMGKTDLHIRDHVTFSDGGNYSLHGVCRKM